MTYEQSDFIEKLSNIDKGLATYAQNLFENGCTFDDVCSRFKHAIKIVETWRFEMGV